MSTNNIAELLLFVIFVASTTDSRIFQHIQDVAVSGDYVYIADSNTLHLLHTNLTHISSLTVGTSPVSKITLNDDTIIACLIDGQCKIYETQSLFQTNYSMFFHVTIAAAAPTARIALGMTTNSTFYVGSEGYSKRTDRKDIILKQFKYDWHAHAMYQLRTSKALTITNSNFLNRDFYYVFQSEQFIYYVALDTTGDKSGLTVMRICNEVYDDYFRAVIEVELDCEIVVSSFSVIHSSILSTADQNRFLVIITGSRNGSRVYAYHLADIDKKLKDVYHECVTTDNKIGLPWASFGHTKDCSSFTEQETTECDFGSTNTLSHIPALAARESVTGNTLLEISDEITAALLLSVDNIPFLYMVHINASGHHLTQYHILENMALSIVKIDTIKGDVRYLKHNSENIYAASNNQAFIIKIGDCSLYSDCNSCTKSTPLCGWCTLEGMCLRKTNCQKAHLRNRWLRNSTLCISHLTLLQPHSAISPLITNITVIPASATFPEVDRNEQFNCYFAATTQDYSFALPFVDGKFCDASATSIPNFDLEQIKLQLDIAPSDNSSRFESFTTNSTLTIHNCSFNLRCRECTAVTVCEWCIYSKTCKESKISYHTTDWTSNLIQSGSRCPILLTPQRGWYLQPAGVANELKLYTRNLPSLELTSTTRQIPGYKYSCELRYPSGLTIVTETVKGTPSNNSQIKCQIEHNQITIPKTSTTGVMAVQLNLVVTNENQSFAYIVEKDNNDRYAHTISYYNEYTMETQPTAESPMNKTVFNTLIFNCSYFGHDCSSCIAATSGTDFPCVWCRGGDPDSGKCVQISECFEMVIISAEGAHECPNPQIISVSPTSGHVDGGTVLTITGSNLGVAVHDVNVLVGTDECTIVRTLYKPGKEIVCITNGASSQGEVMIRVQIRRAQTELTSIYNSFYYVLPNITSVQPRYGPLSGGTLVTISGTALDVGNTETTTVTIAEVPCCLINITNSKLMCKTSPKESPGKGRILVEYGKAHVSGKDYLYTPNPKVHSIFPHNTIPVGGIVLNFNGQNLNVTQNPRMVIYIGNNSYTNTCRSMVSSSLKCTAPRLPSLLHIRDIIGSEGQKQSIAEEGSDVILNYTIIMDNAPRPHIYETQLQLTVKPNPVIIEVQEDSRIYSIGSEEAITIIGQNLDTIHITEINVYMGEYLCKPTSVTPVILKCKPETSMFATSQEMIKVFIANGTLEYYAGYVQIINNDIKYNGNTLSLTIAIIVVVIVMIILAITFCVIIIGICTCVKRTYSREIQMKQMPIEASYFSGLDQEGGENIYDHVIEDASKSANNTAYNERQVNNYLYKTYEVSKPTTVSNKQAKKATNVSSSLPQIPQDEYVEMQSHCVQLQNRNWRRNTTPVLQNQSQLVRSRIGSTGEYVDMLPASTQTGTHERSSMQQSECKQSPVICGDYADIEDMAVTNV